MTASAAAVAKRRYQCMSNHAQRFKDVKPVIPDPKQKLLIAEVVNLTQMCNHRCSWIKCGSAFLGDFNFRIPAADPLFCHECAAAASGTLGWHASAGQWPCSNATDGL